LISVNKPAKDFLQGKFQQWYGTEICQQLGKGMIEEVDMRMSVKKPLAAQRVVELYSYLVAHPAIIANSFCSAGIMDCIRQK